MKVVLVLVSILVPALAFEFDKLRTMITAPYGLVVENNTLEISESDFAIQASRKDFPYLVAIISYRSIKEPFLNGGALISSQWILTAAHCIDCCQTHTAVLGAYDLSIKEPERLLLRLDIAYIYQHEEYNMKTLQNDICLIKLKRNIEMNDFIAPINVPTYSETENHYTNKMVNVSGWGNGSEKVDEMIHYVETPILNISKCRELLNNLPNVDMHICIDGTKSFCRGDPGGPLVLKDSNGQRTIIGISSWSSSNGCDRRSPVVFIRVANYLDWIRTVTKIRNEDY